MTKYSNIINFTRTLQNILVTANKQKLESIAKRIKLKVKRIIENILKSDKRNAYIIALSKGQL